MSRYRPGPRPLELALDRLRDEVAPETALAEVQRVWPEAVGEAIAREAHPTSERGGVLTVSCSASVWASELDLMAPAILERLRKLLPGVTVSRLRCTALPVPDMRW